MHFYNSGEYNAIILYLSQKNTQKIEKIKKIMQTETVVNDILAYLYYLNKVLGLYVSVHFTDKRLQEMPETVFSKLLVYNVHRNRYCETVKKDCWKKCVQEQQNVLSTAANGKSFFRVCHAGVKEYIWQISEEGKVVGYVALSGYREKQQLQNSRYMDGWEENLDEKEPSSELLQCLMPPLCRMFELLFTQPVHGEGEEEIRFILRYLYERHGQVTLDDLCRQFGRSRSFISHLFHEKCGKTLPEYCSELKLDYAQELLIKGNRSVSEAATLAGYHNLSYFILCYKKRFQCTPLQFRKLAGKSTAPQME